MAEFVQPPHVVIGQRIWPILASYGVRDQDLTRALAEWHLSEQENLMAATKPLLGFAATHDGDGAQTPEESAWADEAYANLKAAVERARDAVQRAQGSTKTDDKKE